MTRRVSLSRIVPLAAIGCGMLRKLKSSTVCVGLLAAALSMPAEQARAQPKDYVEAGFRVLYMAPVFIAIDKGYFTEQGFNLTFKEISSGALGPASLISGNAQFTDLELKQVADLHAQGKNLQLIFNIVDRVTLDMVVRKDVLAKKGYDASAPLDQRLKVLKGLTFGITLAGAPTDTYARYFLKRAGFDPATDANIVQIGGVPALEAAFRSGRIDAFVLSPPLPQKLENDGVGAIIVHNTAGEAPELDGAMTTWLATPETFAKANPDVIKGYDKAVAKAAQWLKENPDEGAKELAVKWFSDTSPENLKISLGALLPGMNGTGMGSVQGLQKLQHVYEVSGQDVKADLTEGVLWTNAYGAK